MPTMIPEAATQSRPELVSVDGRTYPLESVRLAARVEGGLASSRLLQLFANPHEEALEVVYTMPLPADGAVLGYTVRVGDRVIRGVVEPREEAQAAFEKAMAEGRSAGLLEQNRDDAFRQRLGNIPPHTVIEVEIEVLQPLAALAATASLGPQWEYRFPTVVGIRYPGAPGRVPDTGNLDVDRDYGAGIPTRLEIDVTIADPNANRIASVSHSIACELVPGGTRVRLGEGERLDRDLVLRWDACAAEAGARVVVGGGLPGDDGRYGLVTVTSPAAPRATLSRDLTVLIDASGSMSGEPLAFAKQVGSELLVTLEPGDRFELLAFATEVHSLTGSLIEATPRSVRRAQAALDALRAGGGTEMVHAIEEALKPLRHDAQRQVVLVTDGQIGFEQELLGRIMNRLPAESRIHAVGIGSVPNRTLTRGVARAGRGVELLASDPVTAREAARRLCAATARPVITGVTIAGTVVLRPAADRLRDVFAGQPLVAAVELRREGGTLEVRGRMAGSTVPWAWKVEVPAEAAPPNGLRMTPLPIGALFGREMIADLELTLAATGRAEELNSRIEALGLRHRIASRRTSLVAIAEQPSVEPGAGMRTERIAVEVPAGVSAEGSGLLGGLGMSTMSLMGAMYRRIDTTGPASTREPVRSIEELRDEGLGEAVASWRLAREPRPAARELRDALERMRHEGAALHQAILEKLSRLRTAAEALGESLGRERERIAEFETALRLAAASRGDQALRRRVDELLGRLQSHIEEMSELAEHVANGARSWSGDLPNPGRSYPELVVALDALTRGSFAERYAALVDELNALIAAEFPEVR